MYEGGDKLRVWRLYRWIIECVVSFLLTYDTTSNSEEALKTLYAVLPKFWKPAEVVCEVIVV